MDNGLQMKMYSFTMDCKNPHALAKFYAALLEWDILFFDEEYACVAPPGTQQGAYPGITFQCNPQFVSPVWPDAPGTQQQMAHLDIAVNDLEKAVGQAIRCGAAVADAQFSDNWRVMFDPVGHPFCLCLIKHIFAAAK